MSKYIIGIDLGGTATKIGLFNYKDELLAKRVFPTSQYPSRDMLLSAICQEALSLIADNKLKRSQIAAIGVGAPGPINSKLGVVYYFPNIKGWKNAPIKRIIQDKLGIPVFVDNDVNLMTLAEFKYGSGRGANNMLCMTLGTGVGGGLIINGELYRGANLVAGEVGHIPIKYDGFKCNCGGQGCLERYVGNKRIIELAKGYFRSGVTLEELADKARKGNVPARKVWREIGRRIGFALVGVVNLLNLERVVIGGGVAEAGDILFDNIRQTVIKNAMPIQAKAVKIVKAKLGYDSGLIGSALFARLCL